METGNQVMLVVWVLLFVLLLGAYIVNFRRQRSSLRNPIQGCFVYILTGFFVLLLIGFLVGLVQ
jgi:cytochrome c oxidase subunit IV